MVLLNLPVLLFRPPCCRVFCPALPCQWLCLGGMASLCCRVMIGRIEVVILQQRVVLLLLPAVTILRPLTTGLLLPPLTAALPLQP